MRSAFCLFILAFALSLGCSMAQHVSTYSYDALGQITVINGPGGEDRRYAYDESGNRVIARTAANSPPVASNDYFVFPLGNGTQFGNVLANDSDGNGHPLMALDMFGVMHVGGASADIGLASDGTLSVLPTSAGTITLNYHASDFEAISTGTVTIEILGSGGGDCEIFCLDDPW